MRITTLVENTSNGDLIPKHGLAFYIETLHHKLLFDLGPDDTIFENAKKRRIALENVDTVIISHGHNDHGGALKRFLQTNKTAKIYIQRSAFEKHYSINAVENRDIGLLPELKDAPQICLLDGDCMIDEELHVFTVKEGNECYSDANDNLYTDEGHDDFRHEQNLILTEEENRILLLGCGHRGVINILKNAEKYRPKVCIGGFHLYSPRTGETVKTEVLEQIAEGLKQYDISCYTCHCTGEKAYQYLRKQVNNMYYLACGDCLEI